MSVLENAHQATDQLIATGVIPESARVAVVRAIVDIVLSDRRSIAGWVVNRPLDTVENPHA